MEFLISAFIAVVLVTHYLHQIQTFGVYNEFMYRLSGAISAFCAWFGVVQIIAWNMEESFTSSILGAALICGIGVMILHVVTLKSTLSSVLPVDGSDISRINVCITMTRLYGLLAEDTRASQLGIACFFSYHYSKCQYPFCPISKQFEKGHSNPIHYKAEMLETMLFSVNRLTKKLIMDQPHSTNAKMFYISYVNSWSTNYILAWELHQHLKRHNLTLMERFILHYQMKAVRRVAKKLGAGRGNSLEPVELLRKMKLEVRFQKLLEQTATGYNSFWDSLQDRRPIHSRFMVLGEELIRNNKSIKTQWKQLCQLRGGISYNTIRLYFLFSTDQCQPRGDKFTASAYFGWWPFNVSCAGTNTRQTCLWEGAGAGFPDRSSVAADINGNCAAQRYFSFVIN